LKKLQRRLKLSKMLRMPKKELSKLLLSNKLRKKLSKSKMIQLKLLIRSLPSRRSREETVKVHKIRTQKNKQKKLWKALKSLKKQMLAYHQPKRRSLINGLVTLTMLMVQRTSSTVTVSLEESTIDSIRKTTTSIIIM